MIGITLLGTGTPIPDPGRAGPSTLVQTDGGNLLVDAGRGVMMRLAAAGVGAPQLTAVLITHLHSDHLTDLNDVITTHWVMTMEPTPLHIIGPPGTCETVESIIESLGHDVRYRMDHHDDLSWRPQVEVSEVLDGEAFRSGDLLVRVAPTDHRPVEPSIAFRIESAGVAVVVAGDTVPCASLDRLCEGADALVHTALRTDLLADAPVQRLQEICDYHSSVEQAADTASRARVGTLVLTHYLPPLTPESEPEWRRRASEHFAGRIELGDDLHRVEVHAGSAPSATSGRVERA